MTMNWVDLPRKETTSTRMDVCDIGNGVSVMNLDYGINVYRNAVKSDDCKKIIKDLEDELSKNIPGIQWRGAQVNDKEDSSYVRNCVDIKFKKTDLGASMPNNEVLSEIYDVVDSGLSVSLNHYESLWHLKMHYKEAFNFIKYLPGEYFKIHGDHGPYYSCTVSAVVYLNHDYDGGEIEFVRQGLKYKPMEGDIVVFPSNFVYEHASLEVFSGTKYAVVIMMDYNDMHH